MNDHNLDDLIIDNIDPKNSKTKSFLTIIALAIIVLIVAIILTKIILKDPNAKLAAEKENNIEMISPDLTLQHIPKESIQKSNKDELTLTTEVKPNTTLNIDNSNNDEKNIIEEQENIKQAKKREQELKQQEEVAAAKTKEEEKEKVVKKESTVIEEKTAPAPVKDEYFIQVGSFKKNPSSRFLSVIESSGFHYKISLPSASGTKKLLIGPYENRSKAYSALAKVKDRINKSAFVVKRK